MHIVTGGAGFIGSNVVRGLNRLGITDVVIVDDLEQGEKHLNLNSLAFSDFVDVRKAGELRAKLAGAKVESVSHQGACSDTTERNGRAMMRRQTLRQASKRHTNCTTRAPSLRVKGKPVERRGRKVSGLQARSWAQGSGTAVRASSGTS